MTDVIAESNCLAPRTDHDLNDLIADMGGCLNTHKVQWQSMLLSADGTRLFCHLSAPDTESARIALRHSGLQCSAIWPSDIRYQRRDTVPVRGSIMHVFRFAGCLDSNPGVLETYTSLRQLRCLIQTSDRQHSWLILDDGDAGAVEQLLQNADGGITEVFSGRVIKTCFQ